MQGEQAVGPGARRKGVFFVALAPAAIGVGAMWGPWFTSGSATRNSFGFFRAAQVLGIEWVTPFRVAWFLLPVLLPLAAALSVYGARRSAAVVLAALAVVLAAVGGLSIAEFGVFWGAVAATAAGLGTLIASIGSLVVPTTGREPSSTTAELSTRI